MATEVAAGRRRHVTAGVPYSVTELRCHTIQHHSGTVSVLRFEVAWTLRFEVTLQPGHRTADVSTVLFQCICMRFLYLKKFICHARYHLNVHVFPFHCIVHFE